MWKSGSPPSAIAADRSAGRHLAQGAGRPGPVCATMWTMSSAVTSADLAEHVERLDRDGYTIVRDAFSTLLAEQLSADIDRLEAVRKVKPATNDFEGRHTTRVYNLLGAQHRLRADPGAPGGPPARQAPARRRLPGEQPVVDHDRSRRAGPADPRRRPGDPDRQAARRVHGQQHVGADRLHLVQRRHAAHPRLAPRRPLPRLRRALRQHPGGDGLGQHPRVARLAVARRRGEHAPPPGDEASP